MAEGGIRLSRMLAAMLQAGHAAFLSLSKQMQALLAFTEKDLFQF